MHPRFLLIGALVCALVACSQDPGALFESAKARRAKGDRPGAIVELKSAIQADPRNPAMRQVLGQLYLELRDGFSAEKELRTAVELGHKDQPELTADLAQALWIQGDATKLLNEIQVPQNSNASREVLLKIHVWRGRAQTQLGSVAEARESLAQALKAASGKPSIALEVLEAQILAAESKPAEAVQKLDAVLSTHPRLYDALLLKAEVLRDNGATDETIAAYSKLLVVYPYDLNALVGRSSLFLQKGEWARAEKDVGVMRKEHKDHYATHFQDGLVRFRKGQFRLALESFQASLKRNRAFGPARLYLGMAHLALGEAEQAERALAVFVKDKPDNRIARQMLAAALVEMNDPARALEVLAPVLTGKSPADAAVLNLAAEAHYRLGDFDKAAEVFGRAAQRSGQGSRADEKRAIARLAAGDHEAALEDFERISKARKGPSNVDVALVLAYLRKDPSRAIALIEELDKKAPRQAFLYNLKGVALLQKGEKDEAIASFNEALKIQPSFLPAAANLFKLDVEQGKLEQGRQRFVSVLKADRNHYQALLALSEVEWTSGKPGDAITLLKRAITAYPQQAEPWLRLIDIYLRRGDRDDAMQLAQEFLTRNPNSFAAADSMGKVQLAMGDANSAVATYTRLTANFPRSERAHLALAEAHLKAGRPSDAERSLRRILEFNPDHREGQLAWVGLMIKERRAEEARRYAQALQKERRNAPAGWVLEADIDWAQGKFDAVAKALVSALAIAPRDDLAIRLYEVRAKTGDGKNALNVLQQFVEKNPNAMRARVYLAEVLLRAGDLAGAVKHYEPAARSATANPLLLNNLAYAYYKLNDPRASSVGEQAYRAMPDNPLIQDTLALILLRDGDAKRALALLEKAVKKRPHHPEIRFHLATALLKTGDKLRARDELTQLLREHKRFAERDEAVALLESIGA